MSTVTPNAQDRNGHPRNWGNYNSVIELPNSSGWTLGALKAAPLEEGDSAYVVGIGEVLCTNPGTSGGLDAVWDSGPVGLTDLYVSAINGNDFNDGLTPATALATLVEAERRLPVSISATTTIHVGRADLVGTASYTLPTFRERQLRADLRVVGDGAGQAGADGEAFTVLVPAVASLGGTSNAQIVTTGLVANALVGRTIRITTGSGQCYRTVRSNTTTTIVPSKTFEGPAGGVPVAGDQFEVVETTIRYAIPDVALGGEHVLVINNGSPDTSGSIRVQAPSFYLINFRPVPVTPVGTCGFCIRGSSVIILGLDQNSTTTVQIRNEASSLLIGFNAVDATRPIGVYNVTFGGGSNSAFLLGWGAAWCGANSSSALQSFGGGVVDGYWVTDRGIVFREGATYYMRNGRCSTQGTQVPFTATNLAKGFIIAEPALPADFDSALTVTSAVRIQDNSKLGCAYMTFNVPQPGASALRCEQGGVIELNLGYTCTSVGGYGLLAAWGGMAYGTGAVFTGLSGTLGEGSVDNHSPCAIITGLAASGDMAVGSGRIVRY